MHPYSVSLNERVFFHLLVWEVPPDKPVECVSYAIRLLQGAKDRERDLVIAVRLSAVEANEQLTTLVAKAVDVARDDVMRSHLRPRKLHGKPPDQPQCPRPLGEQ